MLVYQSSKFEVNPKHGVLNPSDLAWNIPYFHTVKIKRIVSTVRNRATTTQVVLLRASVQEVWGSIPEPVTS